MMSSSMSSMPAMSAKDAAFISPLANSRREPPNRGSSDVMERPRERAQRTMDRVMITGSKTWAIATWSSSKMCSS